MPNRRMDNNFKKMKNIFVNTNSSIKETIKQLNNSGLKTLIVLNRYKKLAGTISDGDIRKAILNDQDLDKSINKIFQKKPFVINLDKDKNYNIKEIFIKYNFDIIPVINKSNRVIKLYTRSDIINNNKFNKLNIPLFIFAGGVGSRMKPFTNILPKPLIPVNGIPIIQTIIERFNVFGVSKFYISVNYKKEILKAFFEDTKYKKQINLIKENHPLGTAGSLYFINKIIADDVFVTNCDVFFMINYLNLYQFHKKNKYDMTIVASKKNYEIPYGVCDINNKNELKKINEKPIINILVNSGLYIINKSILKLIKKNKFLDMTELIKIARKNKRKIGVFPISDDCWIDVGNWDQYKKNY